MDAQVLAFVFLFVGFCLLGAELFLPSGGAIGVMCLASFLASAYFAHRAWATSHPLYWQIYISVMMVLIPGALYGMYYLVTKTSFGNRILLTAPSVEEVTPYQAEQQRLESLIGHHGKSLNLMTPGGLVDVNGERLHAIGQNMIIESGTPVEVVGIKGTRVIVRIVTADSVKPPETPGEELASSEPVDSDVDVPGDSKVFDPFLPPEET